MDEVTTSPPAAAHTGTTRFSLRAMEHVVRGAILSVPGTQAVEAKLAGLAGRAFPRLLVQMDPDTQMVAVDATVAVTWPSPVTEVAAACRSAITEQIAALTGYSTTRVNVTVGAAVPGPRVGLDELASRRPASARAPQARTPLALSPVTVRSAAVVRGVDVPRPFAVRSVAPPQQQELRAVRTRPVDVRGVTAPPRAEPRSPRVEHGRDSELKPISVRPSADATRPVRVPLPQPLRAITITPFVQPTVTARRSRHD